MLPALLLALLAQQPHPPPVLPSGPEGPILSVSSGSGTNLPTLPFRFAPTGGAGMGSECAGTNITGDEGEEVGVTRSTTAVCIRADGGMATISANFPVVQYSALSGGVLALRTERAATNLCLYGSDLTQAAWVASNMTTAFTATGPDGTANSATTLTATAGNATVLQTITVASATRATSAYIKRRTGVGVINATRNNGTTWTDVSASVSTNWGRLTQQTFSALSATAANPIVGIRIVTSGDAVDVALFDDEAGPNSTSPILTAGTSVTRNIDLVKTPNPLFDNASHFWVVKFVGVPNNTLWGQSSFVRTAMQSGTSVTNSFTPFASQATPTFKFRVNDGAISNTLTTTAAITAGTRTIQTVNDGGTLYVSSDGSNLVGTVSGAGTGIITTQVTPLVLGADNLASTAFDGMIYGVCIDDRVPARCP